jgi:long-chain acyl-CoA synthetase
MSFLGTIFENLAASPSQDALLEVVESGFNHVSRGQLSELIACARQSLSAQGVKPGDRVALLGGNSARWVAADLAILSEGATMVPLYVRQSGAEMAHAMNDCEPSAVIVADDSLAAALSEAWPEHCPIVTYETLFSSEPTEKPPHDVGPDDVVTIIYTSGTSGPAKGVMLSRANVDFMLPTTQNALAGIVGERDGDKVFHFLPFCFAGSRMMLWTQLYRGNPLMISTDLNRLVAELQAADPNYYLNVPMVLERIRRGVGDTVRERGGIAQKLYEGGLDAAEKVREGTATTSDRITLAAAKKFVFPKIKEKIGPSLEFLVCGSAPLSADTQRWFETLGIPVYQVYGLTETTAIVTMDNPGSACGGKVGVAIDGVEMRVTDENELVTRGPHVFQGYWKRPDATESAIRDGWFHTGDQADIDDAGRLRIIGRVKHLLVMESGHNVPPEPIEEAIRTACPQIEHAFLVGHGRPFLSVIVTGPVSSAEVQDALDTVSGTLPHYKKLRKFFHSDELFTPENGLLTANSKMKRNVINAHFSDAIEAMYQK